MLETILEWSANNNVLSSLTYTIYCCKLNKRLGKMNDHDAFYKRLGREAALNVRSVAFRRRGSGRQLASSGHLRAILRKAGGTSCCIFWRIHELSKEHSLPG